MSNGSFSSGSPRAVVVAHKLAMASDLYVDLWLMAVRCYALAAVLVGEMPNLVPTPLAERGPKPTAEL